MTALREFLELPYEQLEELNLKAKQARLEDLIGRYGNRFGRASLMSGMATGVGFAAPTGRAVFQSNGA